MKVKLKDISITKGSYGINASAVDKVSQKQVSYLRITDIDEFGNIRSKNMKTVDSKDYEKYLLQKNDIVFARTGNSVGKNYFYDERDGKLVYAGFLVKFSLNEDKVYPKYFKYFAQTNKCQGWIKNMASDGSTRPNINAQQLGNIELDLPVYSRQKSIADKLSIIDDKMRLNEQINANLLNLANTLFKHYFPDINTGTDKIGDYIKNFDKLRKPLSKKQRSEIPGKYRYIGATSVNDHIDKYNFDGIYLLLGEDGTVQDEYGFPILQYTFGKFWPNNHAHVLQGKNVSTEWLYLYFSQRNISGIVTGAVQKKVSQKNMNSLKFKLPDSQELKKFDKIIQPLFSKIRSTKLENYHIEELKRVLLTKLF